MLIAFVIDTSPSMNQRTANGITYLDMAKSSVERLMTLREQNRFRDTYFLLTTEDSMLFCV